tara:strand:+ start:1 stop:1632 length:1632 start_codon:yes stop_codon:yes gene_type:complete
MEGLRGDINQRFAAGIAGMEAGLQGNTAGVAKLINQQMLTGTAYRQTAKAFANLEVGMNLSRDETNVLAASLIDTGNKYEISTDKLVGVINSLKETFPAQKLAGMGKDMMQAVMMFQAELGPALQEPLTKVMNMIFDTSEQGMLTMAKLGAPHARERLSAADGVTAKLNTLKDVVGVGSNTVKKFATGSDKLFRKLGVTTEVLGKSVLHLTTLTDAMGDRVARSGWDKFAVDFGLTLNNLKREIMVPFQEGLVAMHPVLLRITQIFERVGRVLGEKFKTWISQLGSGEKALKLFETAFINAMVYGLNYFDKLITKIRILGEEHLPKMSTGFLSVNNAVHWGIIIPLTLVKGIFKLFMNALDTLLITIFLFNTAVFMALTTLSLGMADYSSEISENLAAKDSAMMRIDKRASEIKQGQLDMEDTPAKSAARLAAAFKKANAEPELLGNRFRELYDGLERTNTSLDDAKDRLGSIDDKTPDITAPTFLNETANMLGRSIEGILGVGRDTTAEEILEELRAANEQRAAAAIDAAVVQMGGNPANTR